MGEQPRAVIAMMLHNGVDPTAKEGMSKKDKNGFATGSTGLTPLQGFLQEVAHSPWRMDPNIGPKFDKTARSVHTLLEQSEKAVVLKQKGNKEFAAHNWDGARKAYSEARAIFEAAQIRGHHMAVLWSNEAKCAIKEENWDLAIECCDAGLEHYATTKIRDKLTASLEEAEAESAKQSVNSSDAVTVQADPEAAATEDGAPGEDATKGSSFGFPKSKKGKKPAVNDGKLHSKPLKEKMTGFLIEPEAEAFYPNGSEQGKDGEAAHRPFICDYKEADLRGFQYEEMRRMKEKQDEMKDGGVSARAEAKARAEAYNCDGYSWWQTLEDLEIHVPREAGAGGPVVMVEASHISIQPDSVSGPTVVGELEAVVKVDESTWTLDSDGAVVITMAKSMPGQWKNVFKYRE